MLKFKHPKCPIGHANENNVLLVIISPSLNRLSTLDFCPNYFEPLQSQGNTKLDVMQLMLKQEKNPSTNHTKTHLILEFLSK